MDNKIIIYGVDVSGCEFCEFNNILGYQCYEYIAEDGASPADYCSNRVNCYYKQLKRKEQENEELEKLANEANERVNDCANDIGKLQEDVRYFKEYARDQDTLFKLTRDNYEREIVRLQEENEEIKQDLHEVENACSCFESENADLRKENERLKERQINWFNNEAFTYKQALQEIRDIILRLNYTNITTEKIIDKINSVIGAE